MIIVEIFFVFFLIGLLSFGGGYAMIPLIQEEVVNRHGWLNAAQFSDIIAVAGMSPGPIATNIAIFIGVEEAGIGGAIAAAAGMVLPSLLIILGIGVVFFRIYKHSWLQSSFYGLRSIITGLIIYAAIIFTVNNGLVSSFSWFTISQLLIFIGSLAALLYFRKHPAVIILLSGLIGIAIYS